MQINSINTMSFKGLWKQKKPVVVDKEGSTEILRQVNVYHPFSDETDAEIKQQLGENKFSLYRNQKEWWKYIVPEATLGEKLPLTKSEYEEYLKYHKIVSNLSKKGYKPQIEKYKEISLEDIAELDDVHPFVESYIAKVALKGETDATKILNYFGIDVKEDEDGNRILSSYGMPIYNHTWEDIGIDEKELFKNVVEIEGDANFSQSTLTDLGSLKKIGGQANFSSSKFKTLGNLEYIGEDAIFEHSQLEDLGSLKHIEGDAYFRHGMMKSTANLEYVGGDIEMYECEIKELPNLKKVGGRFYYNDYGMENTGALEEVGGKLFAGGSLKSLKNVKSVGNIDFFNTSLQDFGPLENVTEVRSGLRYYVNVLESLESGEIKCSDKLKESLRAELQEYNLV